MMYDDAIMRMHAMAMFGRRLQSILGLAVRSPSYVLRAATVHDGANMVMRHVVCWCASVS